MGSALTDTRDPLPRIHQTQTMKIETIEELEALIKERQMGLMINYHPSKDAFVLLELAGGKPFHHRSEKLVEAVNKMEERRDDT